jgi:hypothetical protein
MAVHAEFYHGIWQYMAVHGTTFCCLSRFMAVHGGTRAGFAPRGGAVPPADFRALLKALHCLHYPWQLPQVIASTNSSIHALVLVCLGRPPSPGPAFATSGQRAPPPPPRVQPRQQPSLPRASSAPSAGGLGGLVVMNGVGRCTVTESMTRLKR